jgi:hypothetical protein
MRELGGPALATRVGEGDMAKIFVSYSEGDSKICTQLAEELTEHGHEVWIDRSNIPIGANYFSSIEKGIIDAEVLILLLSKRVVDHPSFIVDEVQLAEAHKKQVIPVRIDSTSTLPPGLELPLQNHQYVQLWRNHRAGLEALLTQLPASSTEPDMKLGVILASRGRRSIRRARMLLRDNDVGKKALKAAGVVAAAGVAIAAGAVAQADAERKRGDELEISSTEKYRARVRAVLADCETEFNLAREMSPAQYSIVFRPKVQRLIGTLEGITPPVALHEQHRELVARLEAAVGEFDRTMGSLAAEDFDGARLGLISLQQRWLEACRALDDWQT